MDAELLTDPSSLPPLTPPPPEGIASTIFLNEKGLRAGWRLLIYAVFVTAMEFSGGMVLRHFVPPTRGVFSPGYLFADEVFNFVVIFGAAVMMSLIEHRPPGVYGLPASSAFGKLFWQGSLIGLIEISALMALIAVFDGYSFGTLALHGSDILRWAIVWGIFFVFVGLFEEFLFRGYTQFTLADGIGFWPAAILLSGSFGYVHLKNPGEGPIGAAAVVMIGLVFALTLRRTGNLWLAVGWHASFDFGETFLYSVPNSGMVFDGHLSNAFLHGPKWLTGGTVGPEGSVFSFLTMALLALVVDRLYPPKSSNPTPS